MDQNSGKVDPDDQHLNVDLVGGFCGGYVCLDDRWLDINGRCGGGCEP